MARIAESLRAAGVEVWFDRDELVGGDAWDAKIRRQIAECALFVPVISAATQARLEGYFRIEWKLAAQRTHAMAEEKAFLLPAVIDATRDAEAKVPAEFRAVQWTRLGPGVSGAASPAELEGKALAAFGARVGKLLGGANAGAGSEVGARLDRALEDGSGRADEAGHGRADEAGRGRATPLRGKRTQVLFVGAALAVLVVIGAAVWGGRKPGTPVRTAPVPVPAVDDKSLAVLPFANVGGDWEQEYFSDGLTLEIHKAIERERDLRVTGQASSFSFRGKNASTQEIAAALNVARLVEGSVQRMGSKVRIRVSLTRVADNTSEDLGTFTEEIADVFSLYDKVAGAVVAKLTRRQFVSNVDVLTRNPEAYDLYLKGRALQTRTAFNAPEAAKFFEQAVALDPEFALAWARLAEARFRFFVQVDRSPEVVGTTRAAIDRALTARPNLPEALIMRANWVRYVENDFAAARRDLDQAEALQPPTAGLRYAQFMLARDQDNWPEVHRLAKESIALDPQNGDYSNTVGVNVYSPRGEFALADRHYARAREIQGLAETVPFNNQVTLRARWRGAEAALRLWDQAPAGQVRWDGTRASLLLGLGRIDEARAAADAISVSAPRSTLGVSDTGVGAILLALGWEDRARAWAEATRAEAMQQFARGNRAPNVRRAFAGAEIILGHRDSALALLKEWRAEMQRVPSVSRRVMEFNSNAIPSMPGSGWRTKPWL